MTEETWRDFPMFSASRDEQGVGCGYAGCQWGQPAQNGWFTVGEVVDAAREHDRWHVDNPGARVWDYRSDPEEARALG